MTEHPRVNINVGDEIIVNGHVFKLMEFSASTGEPARVDFRQLVELVDRRSEEPKTIGEAVVHPDSRDHEGWVVAEMTVTDEEARKLLLPDMTGFSIAPETFKE
jgi:hypothetical protein